MLTHIFSDRAKTNTGEVVYGESSILRIIHGEHATTTPADFFVPEPLRDSFQAHSFAHLVEHDLDEDTATGSGVVLSQLDTLQHSPRDRVCAEEMAEEAGDVPQTVRLVSMNGGVVFGECTFEAFVPNSVQLAETFANETIEIRI